MKSIKTLLWLSVVIFMLSSCKSKKTNSQRKDSIENSSITDTSSATPKKEDIELSKIPDQDIVTNSLETDAKKYAELLCKVQKNGESSEIAKELQRIVDHYSNRGEEFGKVVEREFKNCR